jgi:hypothetical protein
MSRPRGNVSMDPVQLKDIEGAALFYPCCGGDLQTPIQLFASAVGAFYFVDVNRPRRGFLVTHGSNLPQDGPPQFGSFHGNHTIGAEAVLKAQAFEFAGRSLRCVGYAGERYGPTLVWQAAERENHDGSSDTRSRYGA